MIRPIPLCIILALFTCVPTVARTQVFEWAHEATGRDISGSAIALDSSGNLYYTGSFDGDPGHKTSFGSVSPRSFGATDIFVAKYDTAGNLKWVRSIGGTKSDYGHG